MDEIRCTRCGAILDKDRIVWLEFQSSKAIYHPYKYGVQRFPEEDSQGLYPFGSTCAKYQLKEDDDPRSF